MSKVRAEMVATIQAVCVAEGDEVSAGDTLLLLESMKMEIPVLAESAGTVTSLPIAAGTVVQEGDVLVVLAP